MHTTLATATTILFSALTLHGQVRYTGEEFREYYDWFHQYSQTEDPFIDGTTLYTFVDDAKVYRTASARSSIVASLPIAHPISNILIPVENAQRATINGYTDQWLQVEGCDGDGNNFTGFVWGGHIAKGWRAYDLNRDGNQDLVMFGLNQQQRNAPEDLRAEIRLVANGKLIAQTTLTGMCVFEECESSTLLRILTPTGSTSSSLVLETSVLTVGCMTGVDKAFVSWDGQNLQCIYQAEFTTGHQYANRSFYLPAGNSSQTQVCMYSHEDQDFNPVWRCETVTSNGRASVQSIITDDLVAAR